MTTPDGDATEELIKSLVKSAITYGHLDLTGLSQAQAKLKVDSFLRSSLKNGFDLIDDHRDYLLDEARQLVAQSKNELAIVVYATWWEHWINGLLQSELYKRDITGKEFNQVISALNNKAKSTWFLKLIGLPPFDNVRLTEMEKLATKRNKFVHYKYQVTNQTDETDYDSYFLDLEKAVSYFLNYEQVNVFSASSL